jgi:hypothetical protein
LHEEQIRTWIRENTKKALTAHDHHVGRELRILRRFCERLAFIVHALENTAPSATGQEEKASKKKKKHASTHEVPPLLLDRIRLAFRDNGPHELGYSRSRVQLEVEHDLILGRVEEVDEPPEELDGDLEEVVSRAQGEDGVQGGDAAPAGREGEEVAVAVRGQRRCVASGARRCGTRELLLEDVQVRLEPACVDVRGEACEYVSFVRSPQTHAIEAPPPPI